MMSRHFSNTNILFLQGPMGTFFKKTDRYFTQAGATIYKIGFNAGDWLFSNTKNYIAYRGKKEMWGKYIYTFLKEKKIDMIFLFGDCRYYQRIALQVANELHIDVFVFEEGYIRPDYVTMERFGVNDFSRIPRNRAFYLSLPESINDISDVEPAHPKYYKRAWSATFYFILKDLFAFRYPHYRHHTKYNFIAEAFFGIRNLFRKYVYAIKEYGVEQKLTQALSSKYFFVPLQTYNDFQLIEHSPYPSIEAFIDEVVESFARYAPKDTLLLIKHHPMDRGRKNYDHHIRTLAKQHNIQTRVISAHDIHVPTCLKHALGTVTINSTVGLSSLYHATPVITLGNALYDIEGLTCTHLTLDRFWTEHTPPEKETFQKFRSYLIRNTQLNGSFYGKYPDELFDRVALLRSSTSS